MNAQLRLIFRSLKIFKSASSFAACEKFIFCILIQAGQALKHTTKKCLKDVALYISIFNRSIPNPHRQIDGQTERQFAFQCSSITCHSWQHNKHCTYPCIRTECIGKLPGKKTSMKYPKYFFQHRMCVHTWATMYQNSSLMGQIYFTGRDLSGAIYLTPPDEIFRVQVTSSGQPLFRTFACRKALHLNSTSMDQGKQSGPTEAKRSHESDYASKDIFTL